MFKWYFLWIVIFAAFATNAYAGYPVNSVITPTNSVITPSNSVITPQNSVITPTDSVIHNSSSVITPVNSVITQNSSNNTCPDITAVTCADGYAAYGGTDVNGCNTQPHCVFIGNATRANVVLQEENIPAIRTTYRFNQ